MPTKIYSEICGYSTSSNGEPHNRDNPNENHPNTIQSAMSKNLDVKELEMLLEPYFVQIDGTLNKLSTVCNPILPLKVDTNIIKKEMNLSYLQALELLLIVKGWSF